MGARLLRNHLIHPIFDTIELNRRYNLISTVLSAEEYISPQTKMRKKTGENNAPVKRLEVWRQGLYRIGDMEKRYRSILTGQITPLELYQFGKTMGALIELLDTANIELWGMYDVGEGDIERVKAKYKEYVDVFDLELLEKYNSRGGIDINFFKPGHYPELDEMHATILGLEKEIEDTRTELVGLIEPDKPGVVSLEFNESEGYYYKVTTKRRADILRYKMKTKAELGEKYECREVSVKSAITKVFLRNKKLEKYRTMQQDIGKPVLRCFDEFCAKMVDGVFVKMIDFLARFDVVCSHCQCVFDYNYVRPVLTNTNSTDTEGADGAEDDEGGSSVEVMEMRHPIVERILTDEVYTPHNLKLDRGMLLYGVNSAGKSCLLKAVGLNVIMAQIGMYVACGSMKLVPFRRIFTRICGEDNMFQGMSSFMVEMKELRSVIHEGDRYSLVLGDEICKGTEYISALAIVSASLKRLVENGIKFVFATHLHRLISIPMVKEILPRILLYHLTIRYDAVRGVFVFDRTLEPGNGNMLYGLEMARYIIDNAGLYEDGLSVRDELLQTEGSRQMVLADNRSTYNSEVIMNSCQICDKKTDLDVHHIRFQSECKDNYGSHDGHVSKHSPGNLVVLCKMHHQMVHSNKLKIGGYKNTNQGTILEYQMI